MVCLLHLFFLQDGIVDDTAKIVHDIVSWVEALDRDLICKQENGTKSGFLEILEESRKEFGGIWRKVIYHDLHPKFEEIHNMMAPVSHMASRISHRIWSQMTQLQHHYSTILRNVVSRSQQELKSIKNVFIEGKQVFG